MGKIQNKKDELKKVKNKKIIDGANVPGTFTGTIVRSTKLPQGYGKMRYDCGKLIYEGHWIDGRWEGEGTLMYNTTGDTYEGQFQNFKCHGKGKYVWFEDASTYEGDYVNDERHGQGVYVFPD